MGLQKVCLPLSYIPCSRTEQHSVRILALAFGSLVGSTLISGLIVLPALIVHFYWYKPHPDDHRRYVKDNVEAWLFWAAANLIISWYLALIIDVVPIVANYLLAIVWGHVSESVKTKTELYNSVKDTIKPLFYAASAWASWVIIFEGIYGLYNMDDNTKSRAQYTNRVCLSLTCATPCLTLRSSLTW